MSPLRIKNKYLSFILALLRIIIGWHFLYEGLIKIFNPEWTARPFLEESRWIFGDLFRWLAAGDISISIIDAVNAYGLTIIGLSLILGFFTRIAAYSGVMLLFMYYIAYPPFGGYGYGALSEGNYLLVNKNLIELFALILLAISKSGYYYGLDKLIDRKKEETSAGELYMEDEGEIVDDGMYKRREIVKGLAGIPILTIFSGAFINSISDKSIDAISGASAVRIEPKPLSEVNGKIPTGNLGDMSVSRMIMGCNLIGGWAHARDLKYANTLFKAYNTDSKVLETLHLAEMAGINTTFMVNDFYPLFNKYLKAYGGKMKSICQTYLYPEDFFGDINRAIDNGADTLYIQGAMGDRYVNAGEIGLLARALEYIKKKGYQAGMGAHSLEVIKACEKEDLPVDYYVKTFHHDKYWSAHPESERVEFSVDNKKYLDHNMIHDNMFDLFPDRTMEFMGKVRKPWIAFKVLAGGAIVPEDGFRFAFENGADFICVGMFDFQVVDNVNTVNDILSTLNKRKRDWFS